MVASSGAVCTGAAARQSSIDSALNFLCNGVLDGCAGDRGALPKVMPIESCFFLNFCVAVDVVSTVVV